MWECSSWEDLQRQSSSRTSFHPNSRRVRLEEEEITDVYRGCKTVGLFLGSSVRPKEGEW